MVVDGEERWWWSLVALSESQALVEAHRRGESEGGDGGGAILSSFRGSLALAFESLSLVSPALCDGEVVVVPAGCSHIEEVRSPLSSPDTLAVNAFHFLVVVVVRHSFEFYSELKRVLVYLLTNITTISEQPNLRKFLSNLFFLQLTLVHLVIDSAFLHQRFVAPFFP